MTHAIETELSRRNVLARGGALIVGFSLFSPSALLAQRSQGRPEEPQNVGKEPRGNAPRLPGSLKDAPMLDAWIRVDADGRVTVFTGKAELGQGIKTALIQVAAEELDVAPETITLITADTGRTPNEGFTAGSHSMQDSGTAIMNAAAQVREILIGQAAGRLNLPAERLRAEKGRIVAPDGRGLGYGELVADDLLHVRAAPDSKLKDPGQFTVMGKPMRRVDIPAKLTGGAAYVQDLRLPGMVHARVVRPPSYGARLVQLDAGAVEKMPGVLKLVRDGSYLAVVAEREFQAISALRALTAAATWDEDAKLPDQAELYAVLRRLPSDDHVILDRRAPAASGVRTL